MRACMCVQCAFVENYYLSGTHCVAMLYPSLEGIQTPCNRYMSPLLSSLSSSPPSPQCADSAKVGSVVDRVLAKIRERAGGQGGIKGLARYGRTCG